MVRDENSPTSLDVDSVTTRDDDRLSAEMPNEMIAEELPQALATEPSAQDDLDEVASESEEMNADPDWSDARQAWEQSNAENEDAAVPDATAFDSSDPTAESFGDEPVVEEPLDGEASELAPWEDASNRVAESIADPFVGRWNRLISSTNWEKGRIISQWRGALIEAGAAATEFSDEAWAKRVGGVTASHVGRLRRVYDVFGDSHETYQGLFWTHFLIALDWDDAPLWLEGAVQSGWSVSQMRTQRWEASGGQEQDRPSSADPATNDLDEDFDEAVMGEASGKKDEKAFTQPGQGGGSTKEYGDGPNAIGSGPGIEGPDFGDEESLNRLSDDFHQNAAPGQPARDDQSETPPPLVQPFAGLPELPNDLADAVELMKLAVLRHKTAGWKEIGADVVLQYLNAFNILVEARGR